MCMTTADQKVASCTYIVLHENRTYIVLHENRTYIVLHENLFLFVCFV